jgi:hypothetical protein
MGGIHTHVAQQRAGGRGGSRYSASRATARRERESRERDKKERRAEAKAVAKQKYAASIGKSVLELTDQEKKLAFIAAKKELESAKEEANQNYAASIGKSVLALTDEEKKLAFKAAVEQAKEVQYQLNRDPRLLSDQEKETLKTLQARFQRDDNNLTFRFL